MIDPQKIKETFVRSHEHPSAVSCLCSIANYYHIAVAGEVLDSLQGDEFHVHLPSDICALASRFGLVAQVCLRSIEDMEQSEEPSILFFQNELNEISYVVCYGIYQNRFVIGEPTFALMQYFPDELKLMWLRGITLLVKPEDCQ
jgi:ABC-type bacteriocin/lantibiotic exporter with double-glycine peptidase domain